MPSLHLPLEKEKRVETINSQDHDIIPSNALSVISGEEIWKYHQCWSNEGKMGMVPQNQCETIPKKEYGQRKDGCVSFRNMAMI